MLHHQAGPRPLHWVLYDNRARSFTPTVLGFEAKRRDCLRHNPEAEILYKNFRWKTAVGTSIKTAGKTSPAVIEDLWSSDLLSHNRSGQAEVMTPQSYPRRSQALPPRPLRAMGRRYDTCTTSVTAARRVFRCRSCARTPRQARGRARTALPSYH